jgi:hypothetical protein
MAAELNGHADGPTIPASADTPLRFQLGKKPDEPERLDAPAYRLRGAKATIDYHGGMTARGFRYPPQAEVVQAIVLGIESVRLRGQLPDDVYAEKQKVIEDYEQLPAWDVEKDGPKPWARRVLEAQWADLYRWAEEQVPAIAEIQRKRQRWQTEWPRAVCRAVLLGWERREGECVIVDGEATDATLALLEDETIVAITTYWLAMAMLSKAQKKTSDSPPPSDATPKTIPPDNAAVPSVVGIGRSRGTKRGTKPSSSTPAG